LKKELQVSTNIPILLKYENEKRVEIDLNHNAVKTFIEEFKDHCKYEDVKKFVNIVDLNFGRHVFATEILKRGYDRNYGNEFLGHTSRGNSLFGIYSCLDTNEYINETKKFIDEIEEEYFPRNINVENIK
jgi:site-specific recombinase XerD